MSHTQRCEWFKRIKHGRMLVGDDPKPHQQIMTIQQYITSDVPHPPYSPDLAPADFFPFSKVKTTLKVHRFQTIEEIQDNVTRYFLVIPECAYQEAFQKWKKGKKQIKQVEIFIKIRY